MAERIAIEGVQRILAIASGKGGVGKSTVSVNLALALAAQGYRVGLFDGDVHGPNVPLMLGVRRRNRAEGERAEVALAMSREAEQHMHKGKPLERYNLKVMSIGLLVGEEQPVVPDTNLMGRMVLQMLRGVEWGELDFLLIDLPPGTGEPQITLAQRLKLDGVVLVTTPPDVALLDTTKALNLYRQQGIAVLGLVENMSYYICPVCGDKREIFPRSEREAERAVRAEDVPVLGRIPLSPAVGSAGDKGRPLIITDPEGQVAQAFFALARQLAEATTSLPPETKPEPKTAPQLSQRAARLGAKPERMSPTSTSTFPNSHLKPGFHSAYLDEMAERVLVLVVQKLAQSGTIPTRNEASMRQVVEYYRVAAEEIDLKLPSPLQKELLTFVLAETLAEEPA